MAAVRPRLPRLRPELCRTLSDLVLVTDDVPVARLPAERTRPLLRLLLLLLRRLLLLLACGATAPIAVLFLQRVDVCWVGRVLVGRRLFDRTECSHDLLQRQRVGGRGRRPVVWTARIALAAFAAVGVR